MIYIRNYRTGRFLQNADGWVAAPEKAKTFPSAIHAYDFASQNRISEVEIVFQSASKIESVLRDLAKANKQSAPVRSHANIE